MNDYSYNDILRMQDEAKKRVLEMQKRSRAAADNFNNGSRINAQVHPTEKEELPRVPRAISYPAQLQSQHNKNARNPGKGKSNGVAGFDIKNALYYGTENVYSFPVSFAG